MLSRLSPYCFSLAPPNAVRDAIYRHFAFTRQAIEGLASRHPSMSARERPAWWQRRVILFGMIAVLAAAAFAPAETTSIVTLSLAFLFVPVIAFRLFAAYDLLRARDVDCEPYPRVPDHEVPIYTLLVPLYREAHMLPSLINALTRLDYPALCRNRGLSEFPNDKTRSRVLNAGAIGFLSKPFSDKTLIHHLNAALADFGSPALER